MASVIKGPALSVTVALETRQFTRGIATLSSQMETMGRKIQRVGLYSTIAFGAIAATSASALAQVEYSTTQIATLMDHVSRDTIPTMRDEIVSLSKTFGQSFDDMAKARYDIVSAGFRDIARSATVLRAANELALAGAADVGTTSRVIVQALKAYSLEADKAAYISDLLFQTVKIGLTTVPELADALGSIFSTAKAAGVSLEQLSAAVSVLTLITGDTNESVNALNRLLFAMSAPTDQAAEALREWGIEVVNADGSVKDLIEVIAQFRGMNLGQIKELIGGRINAAKAMSILSQNTMLYRDALDAMTQSQGTATKAATLMMGQTTMKWRVMKQTFNAMRVEIGKTTEKDMVGLMESLTGMMEATIKYTKENKTLITSVFDLGLKLSGLALAFGITTRMGSLLLRLFGKSALGGTLIAFVLFLKAQMIPTFQFWGMSIKSVTLSVGILRTSLLTLIKTVNPVTAAFVALLIGLETINKIASNLEKTIEYSTMSAYPEHIAKIKAAATNMHNMAEAALELKEALKKNDKEILGSYRAFTREFLGNVWIQIAGFQRLRDAIKNTGIASSTQIERARLQYEDMKTSLIGMKNIIDGMAGPGGRNAIAVSLGFKSYQEMLDILKRIEDSFNGIAAAVASTQSALEKGFIFTFRDLNDELYRFNQYLNLTVEDFARIQNALYLQMTRRGGKTRLEIPIVQDELLNDINDQHYENVKRISEITLNLGDALNILFNKEVRAIASTNDIKEAIGIATDAGSSMFSELANIASRARQDVLSSVFDLFASILALVNMIKANAQLSAAEAIPGIGAVIGAFAVLSATLSGKGRRRYQSGGVVQGHGTGHSSMVAVQDQEVILSKDMARAMRRDGHSSNININISPSITLPSGSRADVQRAAAAFSKESERELVRTIKNLQLRGVL